MFHPMTQWGAGLTGKISSVPTKFALGGGSSRSGHSLIFTFSDLDAKMLQTHPLEGRVEHYSRSKLDLLEQNIFIRLGQN